MVYTAPTSGKNQCAFSAGLEAGSLEVTSNI